MPATLPSELPVCARYYDLLAWSFERAEGFPRLLRPSLTQRWSELLVGGLEQLPELRYAREREGLFRSTNLTLEKLRVLSRLLKDRRALSVTQYEFFNRELNESLLAAYRRARRGKRGRPAVERFSRRLEAETFTLQEELVAGRYRPGSYTTFQVWDPKERTISVAPFRDRVVHHAVVAAIQPHLERGFDPDSYGCGMGKGTDGALTRARGLAGRYPFKDRRLLELLEVIVRSGGSGRGLPLGNLTSQWLANLYLTPLDRFARSQPEALGYVRYCDELLVFGKDPRGLRGLAARAGSFVAGRLGLGLKGSATQVHATARGIPFLGFRVTPGGLRVRRPTWRRFVQRLRRREWEYRSGRIGLGELRLSVEGMLGHLARAPSLGLRRQLLAGGAPVEW